MAELSIVRRYARALFDSANKSGTVAEVEEDLKTVDQLIRTSPRFYRALRAPTIAASRKKDLILRGVGDRIGPLSTRFLSLLIDKRREDVLGQVYAEYHRLANEARNILPVSVTSAVPLTDEERDALAAALAQRTGKQILLQVSVQPEILGGVMLRMGDTVVDGSVRSRLEQLRARLSAGRAQ